VFLSLVTFGAILSWLFDLLNAKSTENSELVFEKCKVDGIFVSSGSSGKSINYKFLDTYQSLRNISPTAEMRQAAQEGRYDKYYLELLVKKGLLFSYIIEDWDFVVDK
jgi:hypothetical protein